RSTLFAHGPVHCRACRCELRVRPCGSSMPSVPGGELATYDACQSLDEVGRGVRRFDALETLNPGRLSLLAAADVDVVQRLEVIGQELYWRDDHLTMPVPRELWQDVEHVRFEPFLRRVARALIGERPLFGRQLC